jgi:hypothetical protein
MYQGTHITATGNVGGTAGGVLQNVVLSAGSAAATLTLRHNGSGGDTILIVTAPANETTVLPGLSMVYSGQLHATLAGSGATATLVN